MSKYLLSDKHIEVKLQSPSSYWSIRIPYDTATISIPTVPAWIDITDADDELFIVFTPTVAGEYGAYDFGAFMMYVNVTASIFTVIDSCCTGEPINIGWYNRLGAFQSFNFNHRRTYGIEGGSASTFLNDLTIKYNDVNDVYQAVDVDADMYNRKQIDYVATLRYSIQAFIYNSVTDAWDIPILIDRGSFIKYDRYGVNEQQFPFAFKFRFIYADKILVQTQ